jgi:hypothetical protein
LLTSIEGDRPSREHMLFMNIVARMVGTALTVGLALGATVVPCNLRVPAAIVGVLPAGVEGRGAALKLTRNGLTTVGRVSLFIT